MEVMLDIAIDALKSHDMIQRALKRHQCHAWGVLGDTLAYSLVLSCISLWKVLASHVTVTRQMLSFM